MAESAFSGGWERSMGQSSVGCPVPAATAGTRSCAELTVESRPAGDRVLVVAAGELDIDSERMLERALRGALGHSAAGVDLDLGQVGFMDCSGLNVLLAVRQQALGDGKTLTVRAAGPAVERLFEVTGTRSLFEGSGGASAVRGEEGARVPSGVEELRVEVVQLRRAMRTRPTIDLARGVLMASFRLSPEEAWSLLVTVSQRTNVKLHRLADELLGTVRGEALAEDLQREFGQAVAAIKNSGCPRAATDVHGGTGSREAQGAV